MDRRTVLAVALVGLLAALAGCSGEGSISMDQVDDEALTERASHNLTIIEPGQDRALVREAIENGSVTTVGDEPPVSRELPLRHDGGFYDISHTAAGSQPGYTGVVEIDYNASTVDGETVDYQDLPAVDQRTLDALLTGPRVDDSLLEPGYDRATELGYTESEANSSVLVVGQEYDAVRYEGETYPLGVSAGSQTLTVYRYEASTVAETAGEYATTLREDYEFELSGLSDSERDVVDDALNGTKYIDDSDNSGFDSLVDRFRQHQPVVGDDDSGNYLVRYDGERYWVEVNYGSYIDGESRSN